MAVAQTLVIHLVRIQRGTNRGRRSLQIAREGVALPTIEFLKTNGVAGIEDETRAVAEALIAVQIQRRRTEWRDMRAVFIVRYARCTEPTPQSRSFFEVRRKIADYVARRSGTPKWQPYSL
jgi:hypothetical protein